MKVFISWSGHQSHQIATILRNWLPSVVQVITPYVSSEDIDKGARWSTDIAKELDESSFGILCVTKENIAAPWLNFEAGALGKSVDKSRVCPFLFRVKRSDVSGPLLQFQSTICEREDVLKLLESINSACKEKSLPETRLADSFDVWWPHLQQQLDTIPQEPCDPQESVDNISPPEGRFAESILEEILELTRINQKLLRSPEEMLPAAYLRGVIQNVSSSKDNDRECPDPFEHPIFDEFIMSYREIVLRLREVMRRCPNGDMCRNEIRGAIKAMSRPVQYVLESSHTRFPRSMIHELLQLGDF